MLNTFDRSIPFPYGSCLCNQTCSFFFLDSSLNTTPLLYFVPFTLNPRVQVLVRSSVLLRLLEQQAAGLLQAEPGDERYCRECLAGKTSADRSPPANDKQPAKNNRSAERDWEHAAFLYRLLRLYESNKQTNRQTVAWNPNCLSGCAPAPWCNRAWSFSASCILSVILLVKSSLGKKKKSSRTRFDLYSLWFFIELNGCVIWPKSKNTMQYVSWYLSVGDF